MISFVKQILDIFSSPQRFWSAVLDVAFILSLVQLAKIFFDKRYESDEVFKTNMDLIAEAFCRTEAYQDPLLFIVHCIVKIIPYLVLCIQIYVIVGVVLFGILYILGPIIGVYLLGVEYMKYIINLDRELVQKSEAYSAYREDLAIFLFKIDPNLVIHLFDIIVVFMLVITLIVGVCFLRWQLNYHKQEVKFYQQACYIACLVVLWSITKKKNNF